MHTKYKIITGKQKVYLFPERIPEKNRRLTPREMQWERQDAAFLKRPLRHFIKDPPTYPYTIPEPLVNFNLNYQ